MDCFQPLVASPEIEVPSSVASGAGGASTDAEGLRTDNSGVFALAASWRHRLAANRTAPAPAVRRTKMK